MFATQKPAQKATQYLCRNLPILKDFHWQLSLPYYGEFQELLPNFCFSEEALMLNG